MFIKYDIFDKCGFIFFPKTHYSNFVILFFFKFLEIYKFWNPSNTMIFDFYRFFLVTNDKWNRVRIELVSWSPKQKKWGWKDKQKKGGGSRYHGHDN